MVNLSINFEGQPQTYTITIELNPAIMSCLNSQQQHDFDELQDEIAHYTDEMIEAGKLDSQECNDKFREYYGKINSFISTAEKQYKEAHRDSEQVLSDILSSIRNFTADDYRHMRTADEWEQKYIEKTITGINRPLIEYYTELTGQKGDQILQDIQIRANLIYIELQKALQDLKTKQPSQITIKTDNRPLQGHSCIQFPQCRIIAIRNGKGIDIPKQDLIDLSIINSLAKGSSQRLISENEMVSALYNKKPGTPTPEQKQRVVDLLDKYDNAEFYLQVFENEKKLYIKGHAINVFKDDSSFIQLDDEKLNKVIRTEEFAGQAVVNGNEITKGRAYLIMYSGLFDTINKIIQAGISIDCLEIPYKLLGRQSRGKTNEKGRKCELFLAIEITHAKNNGESESIIDLDDVYLWAGAEAADTRFDIRQKIKKQLNYLLEMNEIKAFQASYNVREVETHYTITY